MNRKGLLVSVIALYVFSACSEEPTQFLVVVDSDLEVPQVLSMVKAEIRGEDGSILGAHEFALAGIDEPRGVAQFRLPLSFGVVSPERDFSGRVIVEVSAVRMTTVSLDLFTRRAVTRFITNRSLILPMFLASQCRLLSCPSGHTCTEDGCASEEIDETKLKDSSGSADDLVLRLPSDAGVSSSVSMDSSISVSDDSGG